jgi:two-component system chemotaxis response regulator CheY
MPKIKILIVEDDFLARKLLNIYLSPIGEVDVATNGTEAVSAVKIALDEHQPYDLICLDIMMPETDGIQALKQIRNLETQEGLSQKNNSKVIMTTALSDKGRVVAAAHATCDAYIIKPVTKSRLFTELRKLGFEVAE